MKKTIPALAAAAALTLTACSARPQPWPPTMAQALRWSGCAHMTGLYHGQMFTSAAADCTLGGRAAQIATFPGPGDQRMWEQFGRTLGFVILKDGPGWAVASR